MRRLLNFFLAAVLASTTIGLATLGTASAASDACVNKTGAGMSMGNRDMAKMDHGNMGTKNKMKMNGKTHAMGTSCPTVAGAREISIFGDAFTFTPTEISAKAGEDVTIALTAKDIGHDVYVKGIGHIVHADAKATEKGGIRIDQPGTYKFWCTVAGHKKAGMTGTITVT